MTINTAFLTTYTDKRYARTTTVRHKGMVIAFAMDQQRRIYYSVLDLSNPNAKTIDKDNWLKEPQLLKFPAEIVQVGFGGYDLTPLPLVKKNGEVVTDRASVRPEELDEFCSSTARLSASTPFQVLSDVNYIYLFRQAVAANDENNLPKRYPLGNLVTDQNGNSVPLVDSTLLLDRFNPGRHRTSIKDGCALPAEPQPTAAKSQRQPRR
jgi:hypothetical protein